MRKFFGFVFIASLIPLATVFAQTPNPPPTLMQICFDETWSKCFQQVLSDFGIPGVLVLFVGWVAWQKPEWFAFIGGAFAWRGGLRKYLQVFVAENRIFGFRGMELFTLKAIDLTNAYIQLDLSFSKMAEKEKDGGEKAMLRGEKTNYNLAPILKAGYRKLIIVGDAGSGKSALTQWAGMTVAQGALGQKISAEQKVLLKALGFNRWFRRLTPLIVPLRKFYAHCQENKLPINADALHKYICGYSQFVYGRENLPADLFRGFLKKGCLLMFDGMDEVEFAERANVRAAIEGIVASSGAASRNVYLVTTRPSAADATNQLAGFETAVVQPITPEKREEMINLWCDSVYPTLTEAGNKSKDLLKRIQNPLVDEMAVTPLMINIFALVYFHSRDLPSQRAELFEQAVKALLTDPHKQGQAVSDSELWGGRPANQRFDDMALIAYILHDEGKTAIFADELIAMEEFWKRFGEEKESAQQKAADFLELVARRGGLLRQDGKSYDFYIRRFREFLAGHHLAQKKEERWSAVLQKHVADDHWVEPVLLAVGFLAYTNDNKAKKLMQTLLSVAQADATRRDVALTLAGIALADVLKNPTEQVRSLFAAEKESLPASMREIFEKNPPVLGADLRYRLGLALGEIGDPRFPVSVINGVKVILPPLISIPAGVFRMGTNEDDEKIIEEQKATSWDSEKPAHNVLLSEYSIGKYLVTNAEFRCFVEQGGYDPNATWWSADGRKWRLGNWESDLEWLDEKYREGYKNWLAGRKRRDQPFYWDDPNWNAPNFPVVGISWFEAEAYCKWLTFNVERSTLNVNEKYEFRLPTEAQWEKAARSHPPLPAGEGLGVRARIWAYGNTWDSEKANTDEAKKKLAATSPVGMYPHGASPYGLEDMMGNVWEWQFDWYNADEYKNRLGKEVKDPCRVEDGNARAVRGGSWDLNRFNARCASRLRGVPDNFSDSLGFRLVLSPDMINVLES